MKTSFVLMFICGLAMIAVLGCEKEILLIPKSITSDDYYSSSHPNTNMLSDPYSTKWVGKYYVEQVYYYFATPIFVTEIYVHVRGSELDGLHVSTGEGIYLGVENNNIGAHSARSYKADNVYVDTDSYVLFGFRTTSSEYLPHISLAQVYGCYDTSTPTSFPTSVGPTNFPSTRPTTSPTMPPVTPQPSKTPSWMPTTSPTMSPTAAEPTSYPSIYPTSSPTNSPSVLPTISPSVSPTPLSAEPSLSPSVSPTPLSAEPSLSPTVTPTVFKDEFSLVLGETSLFVAGGMIFIFCVGLFSLLWFVIRRNLGQKQVVKFVNISDKNAMPKIQTTPNIEDMSTEGGRVKNENRGNIQLSTILTISEEKMTDFQTPSIEDEVYLTEAGEE